MKKVSYSYIPLTDKSIPSGELQIGDYVTPIKEMKSIDLKYTLTPGNLYKVTRFFVGPNNSQGFVIDYLGQEWGFIFGKNGSGSFFNKVILTKMDVLAEKYGDIPWKVLNILNKYGILSLKDLINIVMTQTMNVPPEKIKEVKMNLTRVIYGLQELQLIDTSRFMKGQTEKTYVLTQKGKKFLLEQI